MFEPKCRKSATFIQISPSQYLEQRYIYIVNLETEPVTQRLLVRNEGFLRPKPERKEGS